MFNFFNKNKEYKTNCKYCKKDTYKLYKCENCNKRVFCLSCQKKYQLCKICDLEYDNFCKKIQNTNKKSDLEQPLLFKS